MTVLSGREQAVRERAELLRELADAVDKDRGHDKSLLTRTMREAASELALATEELRIREQSQIPMIPRGAQEKMDTLLARVTELTAALRWSRARGDHWRIEEDRLRFALTAIAPIIDGLFAGKEAREVPDDVFVASSQVARIITSALAGRADTEEGEA